MTIDRDRSKPGAAYRRGLNDNTKNPQITMSREAPFNFLSPAASRVWRRLAPEADRQCRAAGNPPRRTDLIGFSALCEAVAVAERWAGGRTSHARSMARLANSMGRQFYLSRVVR